MTQQKVTFIIDADHMPAQQAFSLVSNSLRGVGVTAVRVSNDAAQGASKVGSSWGNAAQMLNPFKMGIGGIITATGVLYQGMQLVTGELGQWKSRAQDVFDFWNQNTQMIHRTLLTLPEGMRGKAGEDLIRRTAASSGTKDLNATTAPIQRLWPQMSEFTEEQREQTLAVVNETGRKYRFDADARTGFASMMAVTLDSERKAGKEFDPKAMAALLLEHYKNTLVTDPEKFKYEARSITALLQRGASIPSALAMEENVQRQMVDPEARRSGMGADTIASSMDKSAAIALQAKMPFGTSKIKGMEDWYKLSDAKRREAFDAYYNKPKDSDEYQLGLALQAAAYGQLHPDEDVRTFAMAMESQGYTREGHMEGTALLQPYQLQLANPNSQERKDIARRTAELDAKIKDKAEAHKSYDTAIKAAPTSEFQRQSELEAVREETKLGGDLARQTEATAASVREQVSQSSAETGVSYLETLYRDLSTLWYTHDATPADLRKQAVEGYERSLQDLRRNALHRLHSESFSGGVGAPAATLTPTEDELKKAMTPDEQRLQENYQRAIQNLKPRIDTEQSELGGKPFPLFKDWYKPGIGGALESTKAAARAKYHAEKAEYEATPAGQAAAAASSHGAEASWEAGEFVPYKAWRDARPKMLFGPTDNAERQQYKEDKADYEDINATAPKLREFRPYEEWLKIQPEDPVGAQSLFGPTRLDTESRRQKYKEDKADYEDINATAPTRPDQSMNRMLERLERLAAAIESAQSRALRGSVDVSVQDAGGRPLSRVTSRPRALELLQDLA